MSQVKLVQVDGQQLAAPEPEPEPLTPIERRMYALFGRPTARAGDLTRAMVKQQAWQLRQGMRKPVVKLVARSPLRVVGKAGKRHERSGASVG